MKILKKVTYLLLVLALVLSLVACGETKKPEEAKEGETKTEEPKEGEKAEEPKEGEKPAAGGAIAKLGLGSVTSLAKSKELAEGKGAAQADTTVVALALDAEGKIVDVIIDVAQSKAPIKDDGTLGFEPAATELKTQRDLGDDYKMKDASGLKKEWYEQADALEEAWIGKTVEEALAMKRDEEKDQFTDLASSVTIKVSGYMEALKRASENTVDAPNAEKIGLGIDTTFGGRGTVPAADGKGAKVQFNTNIAATAVDKDGKIAATLIDVAQNNVEFTPEGKLAQDYTTFESKTKKELGPEYGLIKGSEIKKEWFEQAKALEEYLVGKTADEVKNIKVEKKDDAHLAVPAEEDLKSSVTVSIDGFQLVVLEAIENAQ